MSDFKGKKRKKPTNKNAFKLYKKKMKLYLFILLNLIPLALTMRAYVYDDKSNADQRAPHDTGINKTQDDLAKIGVLYWRIDGPDSLDRLDEIAKRRDYKHRDTVSYIHKQVYLFLN